MKPQTRTYTHTYGDHQIQINEFIERRNSFRSSMTSNGLNVRIPSQISDREIEAYRQRAIAWLEQLLDKKPQLAKPKGDKEWQDGDDLIIGVYRFKIQLKEVEKGKMYQGRFAENHQKMVLSLPVEGTEEQHQKHIKSLISKLLGSYLGPVFSKRVVELNSQFFNKKILSIKYRYNQRVWGSCSTTGALNFSTRIFMAPQAVQDYLIIHELSHLIEHNHSDRFWAVVASAMPDYELQEKWLKEFGYDCNF
jgi:predicted metal-dependent hydrolase